ncbi:MAG: GlyGly-CTERM sorting domain-containing protein, partial [Gammaproteobacteria bacterium]
PIVTFVDPALQPMDNFGGRFVLSADGTTAVFGTCSGVVYIYSRINGVWQTSPAAVIHDPSPSNNGPCGNEFGISLAISADGNTALIGAATAPVNGVPQAGMVYVFARSSGVWSPAPVAVFTDPGDVKWDMFGASVALSADGTIALIGTTHALGSDRVFEFSKTAGSWNTIPTAQINIPSDADSGGTSISLSSNADKALIGLPSVNNILGAAYLYTADNQIWSNTATAVFNAPAGLDVFGIGGTLSGNGTVAAIPYGNNVYIYVPTAGKWPSQATTVLTTEPPVADYCGYYSFGQVALSPAGSMLLVGVSEDPTALVIPPPPPGCVDGAIGRAYIYESSDNWMPPNPAPSPTGSSGGGSFGWLSVILLSLLAIRRRAMRC